MTDRHIQVMAASPAGGGRGSAAVRVAIGARRVWCRRAGYDPRAALAFWQRIERSGEGSPPEFLSTHPSGGTREEQIRAWLPEALTHYEASSRAADEALPSMTAR